MFVKQSINKQFKTKSKIVYEQARPTRPG